MDQEFQSAVMLALGRIEQKVDNQVNAFSAHLADDRLMAADIVILKEKNAKWRGVLTGVAAVGSALGATVGYAIELLKGHH